MRIEADTLARLDAESRRLGQTRSQLAKTLLDAGLRMEVHPGIIFRSGPAGRRPGLAACPDVWEIVRVFRAGSASGDQAVREMAELTGLTTEQVRTALRYYAAYRSEIDTWIRQVDEEADAAEAAWRRERDLLQG